MPEQSLHIPNCSLYRHDRNLHGGGVCIYASSLLRVTPVLSKGNTVEWAATNVCISTKPKSSIAVSCVYRPPSSGIAFWDQLSSELDQVLQSKQHILLGDLNIDVLQQISHHYRHLQNFCTEFQLRNVVIVPTRMEKTCLDLALVHHGCPVVNTNVLSLDGISDQDLVIRQCAYQMRPLTENSFRCMRKPALGSVDFAKCSDELSNELNTLPDFTHLNTQAHALSSSIQTVTNRHSPLCRVRIPNISKPRPQPWVTPSLQNLLQKEQFFIEW